MIKAQLQNLQIAKLNEMQEATLAAPAERDLLVLSPTGSGKTVAFLLPLLNGLDSSLAGVQTMIIVPSRELALQIEQVFKAMKTGYVVTCCYGGHHTKTEVKNLGAQPAVVIGTPGRLAYHLRNDNFLPDSVKTIVLDEFDKSLEFGFQHDIQFIISCLRNLRRRILTSATAMELIPEFAGVSNPTVVNFLHNDRTQSNLRIKAVYTDASEKLDTLLLLICNIGILPALIFCNHKETADRLSDFLHKTGIAHGLFHGGIEQEQREKTLAMFRNGTNHLLVTTDLGSRGLDIPEIEYIIHYQLPVTEQSFIHRNGRTARMHATGTCYLILTKDEAVPYLKQQPEIEELSKHAGLPGMSKWATVYVAAGKKDRVSKTDVAGLFLKKGNLAKEELGLIEVFDHTAFVAVQRDKVESVLKSLAGEKMKNKKVKIQLAR